MKYQYTDTKGEHLHSLDGRPLCGTSTVTKIISNAGAFTWWASGCAVSHLGWSKPTIKDNQGKVVANVPVTERISLLEPRLQEIKGMTSEEYLKTLDEAYKAHSSKKEESAKTGTDLHKELESFVRGRMGKEQVREYDPKIKPFIEWCDTNVKQFLWSEAHCFHEELFVGGISDCGAEMNNGEYAIIDFKSAKSAYIDHFIQVAGYALQIERNGLWDADGLKNKKLDKPISQYIVFPFGADKPTAEVRRDTENLQNAFKNCVALYKVVKLDF